MVGLTVIFAVKPKSVTFNLIGPSKHVLRESCMLFAEVTYPLRRVSVYSAAAQEAEDNGREARQS